jgi:hypothetical protein
MGVKHGIWHEEKKYPTGAWKRGAGEIFGSEMDEMRGDYMELHIGSWYFVHLD